MKIVKKVKISFWAAHLTTMVSVSMLLLLIGAIALIGTAARRASIDVKESHKISLITSDSVDNARADALCKLLRERPYASSVHLITKEQALQEWNKSTGEDVEAIAGGNFFTPEIEINLTAPYACADSINKVVSSLQRLPEVEEAVAPEGEMITTMDTMLGRTLLLLGCVAVAMIVISFVLINNTVLLTITQRRFQIHTMQLVGATSGFIRRPFLLGNLAAGVISGCIACLILGGILEWIEAYQFPQLLHYISWWDAAYIGIGLLLAGGLVCTLSALVATSRFLRMKYDDMFFTS